MLILSITILFMFCGYHLLLMTDLLSSLYPLLLCPLDLSIYEKNVFCIHVTISVITSAVDLGNLVEICVTLEYTGFPTNSLMNFFILLHPILPSNR